MYAPLGMLKNVNKIVVVMLLLLSLLLFYLSGHHYCFNCQKTSLLNMLVRLVEKLLPIFFGNVDVVFFVDLKVFSGGKY